MTDYIKNLLDSKPENLFSRPEPTIKCDKCGKLFRDESEEMVWAKKWPKLKNYCHNCYKAEININPSDEQLREWAEDSIDKYKLTAGFEYPKPWDCSYENFENKVKPVIDSILKEKEDQKEKEYHQTKINEAVDLYRNAHLTCAYDGESYDYNGYPSFNSIILINIIAQLLEKLDKLEQQIPPRDILHERFTI
jgi:hypothetical protein